MSSEKRSALSVKVLPILEDNYVFIVEDVKTGALAVVDPSEAGPVLDAIDGRRVDLILNTHHHWDHVSGNTEIKRKTGARVIGPAAEADDIPGIDRGVLEGDTIDFAGHVIQVIDVPSNTIGHIAFWFEGARLLFSGDLIFHLGAGRVQEAMPAQMWTSLDKIRALPPETLIYSSHEYAADNARFAVTIEPDNTSLRQQIELIEKRQKAGIPNVPSTLATELAANPFLRVDQVSVRSRLDCKENANWEVFAKLRRMKDAFRELNDHWPPA
ncbi:hydroxyacylglutathione hydrolase [Neorhizobium huautlense]|uniref:Hydroxyacylglutathione hydrolase n=1 Tax=Neorhizobium huautlense TaxID=67774 RepID=A0ABT9PZ71_9HYPH|nr:hydroxyacylglutathione hydrolase [Neorhizobium huautlense]MDP9839783.1 hydroxyacylglutathione hydrolase [Neorhizobium huautlense]